MKLFAIEKTALVACLLVLYACNLRQSPHPVLLQAEELMEERPDSALKLLERIDSVVLTGKHQADRCLLKTQAQDRNYINHQSDSLIRIACDYYEAHWDPERLMLAYFYYGQVMSDLNDALKAQGYYHKALKVSQASGNPILKARICSNLGMLYTYQYAYSEAISYMKESLVYFQEARYPKGQADVLRDLGRTYWKKEQLDSAVYFYKAAEKTAYPSLLSSIYSELGGVLSDQGQYTEALSSLKASLELKKEESSKYNTYLSLGKLYRLLGQPDSACYYLNKSMESSAPKTKAGSIYQLAQLEKQHKEWEAYVSLLDQFEQLSDSIQRTSYTETLQVIQSLYDYRQVEKEANRLKLSQAITQRNYYQSALIAVASVVILVCVILFMRKKRKEWKAAEERLKELNAAIRQKSKEQIESNNKKIAQLEKDLHEAEGRGKELLEAERNRIEQENLAIQAAQETLGCRKDALYSSDGYKGIIYLKSEASNVLIENFLKAVDTTYPDFKGKIELAIPAMDFMDKNILYMIKAEIKPAHIAKSLGVSEQFVLGRQKKLCNQIVGREMKPAMFRTFICDL